MHRVQENKHTTKLRKITYENKQEQVLLTTLENAIFCIIVKIFFQNSSMKKMISFISMTVTFVVSINFINNSLIEKAILILDTRNFASLRKLNAHILACEQELVESSFIGDKS